MDASLRAYLERPAPRPALVHPKHDDRRLLWLIPLGAACTGAGIVFHLVADRGTTLPVGVGIWLLVVLASAFLARSVYARTQALFRAGTFTEARVVAAQVEIDSEDRTLVVTVHASVPTSSEGYRDLAATPSQFRASLTDRWIADDGPPYPPFTPDAPFPILISADRRSAKLFVNDDEIDAASP
jgi:hypothetical protein